MSFVSNNAEFSIVSDGEVASIINYFSDDMILDIVERNIQNKFRPYQPMLGNVVASIDSIMKSCLETYPNFKDEIEDNKEEIYKKIIRIICNYYNLEFVGDRFLDPIDYYSCAFYLYKFLISEFTNSLIDFFVNYIVREKTAIYDYLKLSEFKKDKDISSTYSKRIYKNDIKLAVIHTNLEYVIDNISGFDITLDILLDNIYSGVDANIASFIKLIVADKGNIFRNHFIPFLNAAYKPVILTEIRMRMQAVADN